MAAFGRVALASSKGLLDPPVRIVSSSRKFCRRLCHIDGLFFVPLFQIVGTEVERFGGAATCACEPGQRDVVQINRAQARRPRPGDVGCSLQNIELRSQTGRQIGLGDFERFVRRLHAFRLRFEDTLALLKIEKRASHFGGDATPRGFERCHCRFAARARGLHSAFGRETVEKMPGRIYPDQITVIEFLSDKRIALVVNFIP